MLNRISRLPLRINRRRSYGVKEILGYEPVAVPPKNRKVLKFVSGVDRVISHQVFVNDLFALDDGENTEYNLAIFGGGQSDISDFCKLAAQSFRQVFFVPSHDMEVDKYQSLFSLIPNIRILNNERTGIPGVDFLGSPLRPGNKEDYKYVEGMLTEHNCNLGTPIILLTYFEPSPDFNLDHYMISTWLRGYSANERIRIW